MLFSVVTKNTKKYSKKIFLLINSEEQKNICIYYLLPLVYKISRIVLFFYSIKLPRKKNSILLVWLLNYISVQSEVSSPPASKIRRFVGAWQTRAYTEGQHPCVYYWMHWCNFSHITFFWLLWPPSMWHEARPMTKVRKHCSHW